MANGHSQEYLDYMEEQRQEYINDARGGGPSDCCGSGTWGDSMVCEGCGDHCGIDKNRQTEEWLTNYYLGL